MNRNFGSSGIGVSSTGPGVIKEYRQLKEILSKKSASTPGIVAMSHQDDPQFPNQFFKNNKWALSLKKQMEKRQTVS